jgi:hypothetical protein
MKKIVVMLVGLVVSSELMAGTVSGQVERIYPTVSSAGVQVVNFRIKNDLCKLSGSAGNTYWRFDLENDISKAWYSILLAAGTSGMPVKVGVPDNCDPNSTEYINYIYQDF